MEQQQQHSPHGVSRPPQHDAELRKQEQQERIARVQQDLAWAIEQIVCDIEALEEALAKRKRQEGGAG